MFQVRAPRILSFEGSVTKATKDPSLRSGQALNFKHYISLSLRKARLSIVAIGKNLL
jgi:hypothetical protein